MKKVLILEDNRAEAEALSNVIYKIDSNIKTLTADTIGKALEYAVSSSISLFIVDIILNPQIITDASGIEFVEAIRKLPQYKYVPVIFVTALSDPRLYAYENLHCYRYLQKPLLYSDVELIIREVLDFTGVVECEKPLKIRQGGILYVIQRQDILYASSKAAKMIITTTREQIGFYYVTCQMLMDMLESDDFIQCSRNTIVNRQYVMEIDQKKDIVKLRGCSEKIRIGKNYKKNLLEEFYGDD